ncbi:lamin tail domain-containing protein [Caldilinea aerophila]|jgi:hypothetical protein|uniref:LTD domain-containing protein n=1 Tax=Caldilinea aerophila (strain DSM 14535 / JCM 11387 / NBRC 104270 / STL-6-O1) TaxID=926550 RepID=I0I3F1_CALAS|nr:lamin tail domain-containing protein [Caldilinea aerophila]BAL99788.1 hypothetical protein CLDAP_17490 [Caldilinea aerophila DSM 14535 = NBRC 104270]
MHVTVRPLAALILAAALTGALLLCVVTTASAQQQPAGIAAQSALRINELMASNGSTLVDPDDPDRTPDWIEIYNPTASEVSLQGLALSDDPARPAKHVITQNVTIPANGFLILYADNAPQRGPLHLGFALSRAGEFVGLYLLDGAGNATAIDEVEFPALERDVAYARIVDGVGAWRMSRPTPGKSNTINPPWISEVTRPTVAPDIPAPTEPFTVSAVITDDGSVDLAVLYYMTATAPYTEPPTSWTPVTMTSVGGDRYEGVIPGMAEGVLVRYYVEATDDAGDSTRFPTLPSRAYAFLAGYQPPRLLINKVVSRNDVVPDPDEPGEKPDWIEIYNPGQTDVLMNGLSITNRRSRPLLFPLPSDIRVPAGGLVTLLIDGDVGQNPSRSNELIWHVGSGNVLNRLENAGDYIGIFGGQGTIVIDEFDWDERPRWGAFGRIPLGGAWSDRVCVLAMNAPNVLCDKEVFLPSVQR